VNTFPDLAHTLSVSTAYRAIVTSSTCATSTATTENFVVNIAPTSVAGTITTSTASVCLGGSITYTLSGYVGSIEWQSLASATATSGTVVGTGASYTANNVSGTVLYVRAVVKSGPCSSATTAVKTTTVNTLPLGGTVTRAGTSCLGSPGVVRVTGHTGTTLLWEYSTDGVNYVAAPVGVGTAAPTFISNSNSNATTMYSFTNITGTTYFRFKSTNGACAAAYSNVVQYTISPAIAGTISGSSTVCLGAGTTLTLANAVGTIAWQKSTNWTAATPTWNAVAGTTTSLATGNLNVATAYRAKVTSSTCSVSTATTENFVVNVVSCGAKIKLDENPFRVIASPNPFAENFKLDVTSSSEEALQIKVYDMLGKLVENRILATTEVEGFEFGVNYPTGVYNVIVTQGDSIKTLRIIKKPKTGVVPRLRFTE